MPFDNAICEKLGIKYWLGGTAFKIYRITSTNPDAKEFIDTLADRSSFRKALALLETVKDYKAILMNPEKSNKLGDGLFELKPTDQVRLPYFFDKDWSLIITHGFIKQGNKTPPAEIKKAKKIRDEYFQKKGE